MTQTLALPSFEDATVVVPAPGTEPGNWSGAASAVLVDGVFWLTYRVRRPLTEGRGVAVVVSRSTDGVRFEPLTAPSVEELPAGRQQVVLPGSTTVAVKDPVIQPPAADPGEWVMWLCCHP